MAPMNADLIALVADRDASERGRLAVLLARLGFSVVEAEDGEAARSVLSERPLDLLVADTGLPGGGLSLIRGVRAQPGQGDTYIVALTAEGQTSEIEDSLQAGADDAVARPWQERELELRLGAALRVVGLQRELRLRVRQGEHLNQIQTEFYSLVAHEIRTPMTAILSSAKILKRHVSMQPEKVERFAGIIVEEGDRLLRLINNLLDLHRIESGRMDWHYEPTDLSRVVRHVAESFAGMASDGGLTIDCDLPPAPLEIVADPDKLIQVLGNLVSNAIKYSPSGGVIRVAARSGDDGHVTVAVEDEGPGVPADIRDELFQRFVRDKAGGIPGTGLGLAIARELVVRHGGDIRYDERPTGGARFSFTLPARTPPPEG
jgi:signal transduction histidine kinase